MFLCDKCRSKDCSCLDVSMNRSHGPCEDCRQVASTLDCHCYGKIVAPIEKIDPELERLLAEEEEIEKRHRDGYGPPTEDEVINAKVGLRKIQWDLEKM